jgi:hypothetical protein
VAKNADERLLCHVFGQTGVTKDTQGQSKQATLIATNEYQDRLIVSDCDTRK